MINCIFGMLAWFHSDDIVFGDIGFYSPFNFSLFFFILWTWALFLCNKIMVLKYLVTKLRNDIFLKKTMWNGNE